MEASGREIAARDTAAVVDAAQALVKATAAVGAVVEEAGETDWGGRAEATGREAEALTQTLGALLNRAREITRRLRDAEEERDRLRAAERKHAAALEYWRAEALRLRQHVAAGSLAVAEAASEAQGGEAAAAGGAARGPGARKGSVGAGHPHW